MSCCITNVINLFVHCLILEVIELFLQLTSQKKKFEAIQCCRLQVVPDLQQFMKDDNGYSKLFSKKMKMRGEP
jgi:hypothetical protein